MAGNGLMKGVIAGLQALGGRLRGERPSSSAFPEVLKVELAAIDRRRRARGRPVAGPSAVPPDLFGLALSGGGIRSASFCLGALQALRKNGLFDKVDYLSTVSGGGYAGAALTADYARQAAALKRLSREQFRLLGTTGDPNREEIRQRIADATGDLNKRGFRLANAATSIGGEYGDSDLVRHIRDHSRFLTPHGFVDVWRSLAIVVRGLVVNAVITAGIMLLAATLLALIYRPTVDMITPPSPPVQVGNGPPVERPPAAQVPRVCGTVAGVLFPSLFGPVPKVEPSPAASNEGAPETTPSPSGQDGAGPRSTEIGFFDAFPATLTFALVLGSGLLGWALHRSVMEARNDATDDFDEPGSRSTRAASIGLVVVAGLFVFEAIGPLLNLLAFPKLSALLGGIEALVLPLAAGSGLVGLFWQRLVGMIGQAKTDPRWSATVKAVVARLILVAASLAVPLVLALLFLELVAIAAVPQTPSGWWLIPTWVAGGFSILVGLVALGGTLRLGPDRSDEGLAVAIGVSLAPLTAGVLVLAGIVPHHDPAWRALIDMGIVGLSLATGAYFLTPNASSLHRLYRDRLETAFALSLASPPPMGKRADKRAEDRLTLSRLAALQNTQPGLCGPFPVINAAINIPASPTVNSRGRNADFFTFTPTHVGSEATGWVSTDLMEMAERQLDLATAVAISGAAVSSSMGRVGIPMLAFTLALFNARLGFWLRNPRALLQRVKAGQPAEAAVEAAKKEDWRIAYLALEMFNRLDENRSRVYVTDGGHLENLGLYQLLKRRCRFIVVVDAEADPGLDCAALVDAERFARIDQGIRIELPWEAIRDAHRVRQAAVLKGEVPPKSPATAHAAVGRIIYSDGKEPAEGVILYVKASVTGDENDYVLDYARRYPQFPHEPTADQFFSEEQMEAYRALGFHAMDKALSKADDLDSHVLLAALKAAM